MQLGNRLRPEGYTFLAVLALLALVSLGLAALGPLWSHEAQRERERELLKVGTLYAQALASYRAVSPGSLKQYPGRLEALLDDRRFVGTMRHMRKLYPDPVNPGKPWGLLIDASSGIIGVHSLSDEAPLAEGLGRSLDPALGTVRRYSELKFIAKAPP
jgi:type II secretory pathway pseudopilin PulG